MKVFLWGVTRVISIREDAHELCVEPNEFLADLILAEHSERFQLRQILLCGRMRPFFLTSIRSNVKNSKILTETKGFVKKYNLHYKRGLPVSLVENFSQKETKKLYFGIFPNNFFLYLFVNQHINTRMRFLLITFSGKTWRK